MVWTGVYNDFGLVSVALEMYKTGSSLDWLHIISINKRKENFLEGISQQTRWDHPAGNMQENILIK